jgi:hypothetical protein
MLRRKTTDAVAIEGIKDKHNDWQINESEDECGIKSQERGAAG